MHKLTVEIPESVYDDITIIALARNTSLRRVVIEALTVHVRDSRSEVEKFMREADERLTAQRGVQ